MTVIFQTNEACNMFHAVIANERRLQHTTQQQLMQECYMQMAYPTDDRGLLIDKLDKQLQNARMLADISVHHVFGWQQRNKDKHRVVLVSFCSNDMHGDSDSGTYAREFFWQEYYVPMESYTKYDGEVRTCHAAAYIPLVGERGMCGGFINHGSVTEPRWGCHT